MRTRILALVVLALALVAFFVLRGDSDKTRESPEGEDAGTAKASASASAQASDESSSARPKSMESAAAARSRLYQELLYRARQAREARNREREAADETLNEREVVEQLQELRGFFEECHEIAAATDPDIPSKAEVMVSFGVTERVVLGEVLKGANDAVNPDFEECVVETATALDLRPKEKVRNISLIMQLDMSRDEE